MELLLQQVMAGLANGAIYACMALAVVMIYLAIDHLNFAQGEMATFSTLYRLAADRLGRPLLGGLCCGGNPVVRRRGRDRAGTVPADPQRADPQPARRFIALFSILNSADGYIWDYTIKTFPTPFGTKPLFGSDLIDAHEAGMIGVTR